MHFQASVQFLPSSQLPSRVCCQEMGNPGLTAVENWHSLLWHCIVIVPYQSLTYLFHTGNYCQVSGVFLPTQGHGLPSHTRGVCAEHIMWELTANLCCCAREECLEPRTDVVLIPGLILQNITSVSSCWTPEGNRMWATENKLLFVHFSDFCNDDQVFLITFHPTPLPLRHSEKYFFSTHNFPLATALIVSNSMVLTERKKFKGLKDSVAQMKKARFSVFILL